MKTDTSMNLMLIVFCIILVGFVILNSRMTDSMNRNQAKTEQKAAGS